LLWFDEQRMVAILSSVRSQTITHAAVELLAALARI
jgi:hypothetical protein